MVVPDVAAELEVSFVPEISRVTCVVYANSAPVSRRESPLELMFWRPGSAVMAWIVMLTIAAVEGGTIPETVRAVVFSINQSDTGCVSIDDTESLLFHSRGTRSIDTNDDLTAGRTARLTNVSRLKTTV